ncbi:MAG: hypothetical protein AAB653_03775 [Patescibacteria group bacterium]
MIGIKQTKILTFLKIDSLQRGTTLLEIIIAISLFSITILLATNIFQSVVDGQRNAISAQNIQENIRYVMETISREIRMAQKSGASDCIADGKVYDADDGSTLSFKNMHDKCVKYELVNTRLQITRDGVVGFITPININVANLKFNIVDNIVDDDAVQPRVSLRMDVEATTSKKEHKQKMVIQTTISSRYYE